MKFGEYPKIASLSGRDGFLAYARRIEGRQVWRIHQNQSFSGIQTEQCVELVAPVSSTSVTLALPVGPETSASTRISPTLALKVWLTG